MLVLGAFLLGFAIMAVYPGTLAGIPEVIVHASLTGALFAFLIAVFPRSYHLMKDMYDRRSNYTKGQTPFVAIVVYLVTASVIGVTAYMSRAVAFGAAEDVALPYFDLRVALVYVVALLALAPDIISTWFASQYLNQLKRELEGNRRDLAFTLKNLLAMAGVVKRIAMVFGAIAGGSTLATAAYLDLLAQTTNVRLVRQYIPLFGALIAFGLGLVYAPLYKKLTSVSRALMDQAYPLPSATEDWPSWHEQRASVEDLLGLGAYTRNALQIALAITAPLLAGLVALLLPSRP